MKYSLLILIFSLSACTTMEFMTEKQITDDATYHHDLDNNDNFSPDNQWLVYDTRTDDGGIAASARIEKVNVETGEKKIVYELPNNQAWGPGAGAVSYSPVDNAVVFIHGLPSVTEANPYQQWRRTGVIIDENMAGKRIFMDARDITAPYTKGALRGGTHRHEWSGNGQWIGYTYNDAVMKALEDSTGEKHNLRTIGVSKKINAVVLEKDATGENISGDWYSVLVVKVTPTPTPGSDEIGHAAGDSWVGTNGYQKADGSRQMARAFIGTVKDPNGKNVDEVFIVDIPDDITIAGESGPLEGTATAMPMPPKGTVQRRLTHTADGNQPGCVGIVRSAPDGQSLAFLAKDAKGVLQLFTIAPDGKNLTQLTYHDTPVEGFFRWHPSGKSIYYVCNGSIMSCETGSEAFDKRVKQLTKSTVPSPTNLAISHDGKTIAFNRLIGKAKQVFIGKL